MRIKLSDSFSGEIKTLADELELPPNALMNLFIKRYISDFKQWIYQPVQSLLPSPSESVINTNPPAKIELIDSDLPPFEM
jgi:hypothetical protein